GGSASRLWTSFLLLVGGVSSFVSNTATVAVLMPVAIQLAHRMKFSPSKILIPLSYASIYGGTVTLLGTSTNLLVSAMAADRGIRPFTVFEFAWLGVPLLIVGTLYNVFFLRRVLPSRSVISSLTRKYRIVPFLTEVKVPEGSPLVGRTVLEEQVSERHELNVLEILRGGEKISIDIRNTVLKPDDVLIVRGGVESIVGFKEQFGLLLLSDIKLKDTDLADANNVLMEVQLAPNSTLDGRSLREIDFRRRYGCFVLALNRQGEIRREKLAAIPLRRWDTLLVFGPRARVEALLGNDDFAPLQELDISLGLSRGWWLVALAFPAIVLLAVLGMSVLKASILTVVALLLTRRISIQRAYRSIDWTVIFMLAAILPLGLAIEEHGVARVIGETLAGLGADRGPLVLLAAIYIATAVLTELISNNAAAVLMVPIAITSASVAGVDPKPLLMAVTFAASTSFLTPMGYQTNTMIYGPGGYRVSDFLKAGFPLLIVFFAISMLLIPRIWPF
ncbi:MAG: sodium:proton antiporter, partial [Thermoanaerobaculia bacterium]